MIYSYNSLKSCSCIYDLVTPILPYGAEVWGRSNNDILGKLHLILCRILLHVHNSTAKCMLYGELGRFPIQTLINQRMLNYWGILTHAKAQKLNKRLYQLTLQLSRHNRLATERVPHLKQTLHDCDLYHCWQAQSTRASSINCFTKLVNDATCKIYVTEWHNSVVTNQKCYNYRMLKKDFCIEKCLTTLPVSHRIVFTRFRLSNHCLPIDKGRHVERCERKCRHCAFLGEEFHYLCQCFRFKAAKKQL